MTGIMLWNITREEAGEIHDYLYKGLLEGFLKPVVRAELPLKDADRAHIEVMSPGAMGKIVLIP